MHMTMATIDTGRSSVRRVSRPGKALAAPAGLALISLLLSAASPASAATTAEILAAAPAADWRRIDDAHTLYLELPRGRVIIELEPALAPRTVANIEQFARLHWYDGLAVDRVQDGYVAQWGDGDAKRPVPAAMQRLQPEFSVPLAAGALTELPDRDGYAAQVGFVHSFPVARDPATGQGWLTHCYGSVGVARDNDPATGNGAELYAVIGHAPRQLDRNVVVVGRVRQGIDLLASLPRGGAEMGFYRNAKHRVPIRSVHLASELPAAARTPLEVLRSDSDSFAQLIEARRNRRDAFYVQPAGYVDLCSVMLPVRAPPGR
jgi:peptidylprolyl isomerase